MRVAVREFNRRPLLRSNAFTNLTKQLALPWARVRICVLHYSGLRRTYLECAPIERSFTGCEKRFCCLRCFDGSGRATREKACERAELRPDGSQESGRRTSRTTTRFRSVLFLVREFKHSQLPPSLSYSTPLSASAEVFRPDLEGSEESTTDR